MPNTYLFFSAVLKVSFLKKKTFNNSSEQTLDKLKQKISALRMA